MKRLLALLLIPSVAMAETVVLSNGCKVQTYGNGVLVHGPSPTPAPTVISSPTPAPTVPSPTPTPTVTPPPSTGGFILPAGATLVTQNMKLDTDGWYHSTAQKYLNSYCQVRTDKPASWVRYTVKRRSNVIPNFSNGGANQGLNDKIWRDYSPDGSNNYVGTGPKNGAWKFTKEPDETSVWFALPYTTGDNDEIWEIDYAAGKFAITVNGVTRTGSFKPVTTRVQFGVQCVIATDPAPSGYPTNAYVDFQLLSFEYR